MLNFIFMGKLIFNFFLGEWKCDRKLLSVLTMRTTLDETSRCRECVSWRVSCAFRSAAFWLLSRINHNRDWLASSRGTWVPTQSNRSIHERVHQVPRCILLFSPPSCFAYSGRVSRVMRLEVDKKPFFDRRTCWRVEPLKGSDLNRL